MDGNKIIKGIMVIVIFFALVSAFSGGNESDTAESPSEVTGITETTVPETVIAETSTTDSVPFENADDSASSADDSDIESSLEPSSQSETENVDDSIRVGAFNIQVFGVSKAEKPEVMDVLADIVRTYDIIAIQEIRDKSQTALPQLVNLVNSDGSSYDYVVSERLGRTSSKEQYAYIYNTNTIKLTGTAHTYPEPSGTDPFHRQPYITSFQATGGNYDAVLIVIHTDPDEATEEINALDDVITYTKQAYPEEQDFILLGDLNADGSYFNENSISDISANEYAWVIDNSQDTTVASSSNTYDRIILTDASDYVYADVFRFDTQYGLDSSDTSAVSDHYPVFAEFLICQDSDSSSPSTYVALETTSNPMTASPTSTTSTVEQESSSSSGDIQIVGISLSDEWVKIKNKGSSPISLKDWTVVDDEDKHTYTFPSFSLAAGATVTLHTEAGSDTETDLYWGSGRPIWNNDGDTARLYDASGELVDKST